MNGRTAAPTLALGAAALILLVVVYAAALLFEVFDHPIKAALGITGGHPLKHLAAAAGTACVGVMLLRRHRRRSNGA